MPSSYSQNLGIELPADGELDGLWGEVVNTNMDIIDRASNGSVTLTLSGTSSTLTTSDGVLSNGQYKLLVLGGSPSGAHTITISPNDAQKIYFVRNTTAQSVIFTQGSGGNVTIAAGDSGIIYSNGGGSGAAVANLTDDFAMNSVKITGGSITGITDLAIADGGTGASDAATARTNLGIGTIATQSAASVTITGGSITGITDLAVADGGTGASDAAAARTNLGLAIGTNVQAYDADLDALAALSVSGLLTRTGAGTAAARTLTGTSDQIAVTDGDGVSGNPTIAAVVASQAEAEAGTNATKLMTPQRVSQAIAALSPVKFTNSQLFTASGTWTCPAGVTEVYAIVIGGGAGGGDGFSGGWAGLSAGWLSVSGNVSVTVGLGGAGSNSTVGVDGGTSSFSSLSATGGLGAGGNGTGSGGNFANSTVVGAFRTIDVLDAAVLAILPNGRASSIISTMVQVTTRRPRTGSNSAIVYSTSLTWTPGVPGTSYSFPTPASGGVGGAVWVFW